MTDEEFRAFMAKLAAEFTARLNESSSRFEKELAQSRAEYEVRQAKLEEQFAKTDAQLAKTDVQLAETNVQLAKTDKQLAKTDARLDKLAKLFSDASTKTDVQLAETNAQLAKTDKQLAKTDARLDKLAKLFGDASNNQGEIAEEFFFRSLERKPQVGKLKFDTVHRNLNGSKRQVQDEFDLVLINSDSLAVIEVKNKAHLELVDNMIEKKIPNLKHLFPQFKHYKIYAGIASLVSYDELVKKTQEKGLFLLTQQGKHIELVNQPLHTF